MSPLEDLIYQHIPPDFSKETRMSLAKELALFLSNEKLSSLRGELGRRQNAASKRRSNVPRAKQIDRLNALLEVLRDRSIPIDLHHIVNYDIVMNAMSS